jgi:hypothetical protein
MHGAYMPTHGKRETHMVINMNAVKAGECKVCGHAYEAGYPVKMDLSTKSF